MGRSSLYNIGTDFNSQHWLSLDPCGLICVSFSYSLHIFSLFASGFTLISNHLTAQLLYGILYVPFSTLSLWSLYKASTTNPGAVPMGARPLPTNLSSENSSVQTERDYNNGGLRRRRGIRRCRKCNDNYKPSRAHHDSVTGRCIVKMDHYCPWVGNAVGIMNHKFFILFILYTLLTAIISLTLIIIRVARCQYYIPADHHSTSSSTTNTPPGCSANTTIIFILSIITILFFCFTFCMLIEQSSAITTNMSKIARMKTQSGLVSHPNEYAPVATEFNEVFGGSHNSLSWHWLLPLDVKFPEWAIDNIMGYEWDPVAFDCTLPYQEPLEDGDTTTDGEEGSMSSGISRASSGMSSSVGRVVSEGGGVGDRLGSDGLDQLGGGVVDVETGNMGSGGGGLEVDDATEPLEQVLLNENEKDV